VKELVSINQVTNGYVVSPPTGARDCFPFSASHVFETFDAMVEHLREEFGEVGEPVDHFTKEYLDVRARTRKDALDQKAMGK
jgi:hypothetical protein